MRFPHWQVEPLYGWCCVPSCRSLHHLTPTEIVRCCDAECPHATRSHSILVEGCSGNAEVQTSAWRAAKAEYGETTGDGRKRKVDPIVQTFFGLGADNLKPDWGLRVCSSCIKCDPRPRPKAPGCALNLLGPAYPCDPRASRPRRFDDGQ